MFLSEKPKSIWARLRAGGAYMERVFPYIITLVALLASAGCGANVQQEPPAGCSEAWSRCIALPDSQLEFASSGVEEIVSCTTMVAGVSSTYACRWPER